MSSGSRFEVGSVVEVVWVWVRGGGLMRLSQLSKVSKLGTNEVAKSFRMSAVGRRHFRSESIDLEETLREKSVEYFKSHHRHSLDELAMFLEMEAWEAVPVKRNFTYKDLPVRILYFGEMERRKVEGF